MNFPLYFPTIRKSGLEYQTDLTKWQLAVSASEVYKNIDCCIPHPWNVSTDLHKVPAQHRFQLSPLPRILYKWPSCVFSPGPRTNNELLHFGWLLKLSRPQIPFVLTWNDFSGCVNSQYIKMEVVIAFSWELLVRHTAKIFCNILYFLHYYIFKTYWSYFNL